MEFHPMHNTHSTLPPSEFHLAYSIGSIANPNDNKMTNFDKKKPQHSGSWLKVIFKAVDQDNGGDDP